MNYPSSGAILHIIYGVVKDDDHPLKYKLHPRDLILRSFKDWNVIVTVPRQLEGAGLISTLQKDVLEIFITEEGLSKSREAPGS